MSQFSAVILAGGRSSRMGLPKAALPFGSSTILERLLDSLGDRFAEVIVVAAPLGDEPFSIERALARRAGRSDVVCPIIERDDQAFEGPVAGLRRGLLRARAEICFACSCDLPLLRPELATLLCARLSAGADAAIPLIAGKLQPLCAAYRRDPAAAALAAMETEGERRLTLIAERLKVETIDEASLRTLDPDLRSFLNVNSAEDYMRALRLAAQP